MKIKPLWLYVIFLIAAVLAARWHAAPLPENATVRVHFIDVTYGDAILVELPNSSTMLIDAGTREHADKLTDYLSTRNINHIDTAIITHPHDDHFGGFFSLVGHMPIKRIFINGDFRGHDGYAELIDAARQSGIPVHRIHKGAQLTPGIPEDIAVKVLHPERTIADSVNGDSMVIQLCHGKTSFLFTADILPAQQDALITQFGDTLRTVGCVKVPHHGGPLSEQFADFFAGALMVICVGDNKWEAPPKEDLMKLQGTVLRTDHNGTVVVESDGKTLTLVAP